MNRFDHLSGIAYFLRRIRYSALITLGIIVLCFLMITQFSHSTSKKQLESLQRAIDRSIIQCYAIEGTYPPSLDYLKAHYGITYDEDAYYVDYQSIGSNLRPDVTIIALKEDSHAEK